MSDLRDPHLAGLLPRIDAVTERIGAAVDGLGPEELIWRPSSGAWSVGLCLEHLIRTFDSYQPGIEAALERAVEQGKPRKPRPWKPSFIGKRLIPAVGAVVSKKLKAPAIFVPGPAVRAGALSEFLFRQALLIDLMREADGYDLSRARTASPVSRLIRLNLGDCFEVLVSHAERHAKQIQRVRDQLQEVSRES